MAEPGITSKKEGSCDGSLKTTKLRCEVCEQQGEKTLATHSCVQCGLAAEEETYVVSNDALSFVGHVRQGLDNYATAAENAKRRHERQLASEQNIWEWRLHAAQQDPKQQATRAAKRVHRKSLMRMKTEYNNILNANATVKGFEDFLTDSQFNADEQTAAITLQHPATTQAPEASMQSPNTDTLLLARESRARLPSRVHSASNLHYSKAPPASMRRRNRFLDMPRVDHHPGLLQVRGSAKTDIADSLRMPDERKKEAERALLAAGHAPSGRELFDAYHDHLKTISGQVSAKLAELDQLFQNENHDQDTIAAHTNRDMALNIGARASGMYEHAQARSAIDSASKHFASVQDRSAELDYSLLHMGSELDKNEAIMQHCSQLLKVFDTMADNHILVSSTAFHDVGAAAGAGNASLASSIAPASVVSSVGGVLHNRRADADDGIWGAVAGGLPIPMKDFGDCAAERGLKTGSANAMSQRTGSSSPISAVPSAMCSLMSAAGNRSPHKSSSRRKAIAPAHTRKDVLAGWMQEHNIQVDKAFHASNVESALQSTSGPNPFAQDPLHDLSKNKPETADILCLQDCGDDQGRERRTTDEHPPKAHTWQQLDSEWHSLGHIVNKVKAERGLLKYTDVGTQCPLIDEGSTTVGHRLRHMPKILLDFAVRGLELPQSWVPFVSGISTYHQQIRPWDAVRVNDMITAIYFHKILLDAEHAHREGIYQISLCEVVVLHMLEAYDSDDGPQEEQDKCGAGDTDSFEKDNHQKHHRHHLNSEPAVGSEVSDNDSDDSLSPLKAALRDFLYGVLTHEAHSDRLRLFLRFCGIMPAGTERIPDLILDYYLNFLLECSPFVLDLSAAQATLAEMAQHGRDFVIANRIDEICNCVCRGTMASARRLDFFAKRLFNVQIYHVEDARKQRIEVVDVEQLWQLLVGEYEEQFEEARLEAALILKAADTDSNGEIDFEELVEVVSLFDKSLSRTQVSKIYQELVLESGSTSNISSDAFLRIGDKYSLFSYRASALRSRRHSLLWPLSWRRLQRDVRRESRTFQQRLNLLANALDTEESAHVSGDVDRLQASWHTLLTQVDIACKDLPIGTRACVQQGGVDDPGNAWRMFHDIKSSLAGQVVNYGVRKVKASLKIIGAVEGPSGEPTAATGAQAAGSRGGGPGAAEDCASRSEPLRNAAGERAGRGGKKLGFSSDPKSRRKGASRR